MPDEIWDGTLLGPTLHSKFYVPSGALLHPSAVFPRIDITVSLSCFIYKKGAGILIFKPAGFTVLPQGLEMKAEMSHAASTYKIYSNEPTVPHTKGVLY